MGGGAKGVTRSDTVTLSDTRLMNEHPPFARLVASLWWFWHLHGLVGETYDYLVRALAIETGPSHVHALEFRARRD